MANPLPTETLSSLGLDEIRYWIRVSYEKFDLKKFRTEASNEGKGMDYCVEVWPKYSTSDFCIHFSWTEEPENKEMNMRVVYMLNEKRKLEEDEGSLAAEEFMEWLGKFFKYETSESHIHAYFEFPLASRVSKFPLPLTTAIEGGAEIDGISLRLPTRADGVNKVRLTLGKNNWHIEAIANRRITFKAFSVFNDVKTIWSIVGTLMEEKTT